MVDKKNPQSNIGIVCTANQLAVIDIDGEAGIEWIRANQLPMPTTWIATTARGFHYYYRWPEGIRIKTCQIAPKLEIRAAGAYVIAPPSIHPSGHTYRWNPKRCDWSALPELPPEWVALQPQSQGKAPPSNVTYLSPAAAGNTVALKRLNGLAKHLAETPKGSRHQALYTIARTLGGLVASRHLTPTQIGAALHAAADRNGLLAEDGVNVNQTIADGIIKGISDGPDPGHHETGERNPYTLTPPGEDSDDDEPPEIDFLKLKTAEFDDTQWLIEPIIPAHRAVALYAAGKTGKSLLILDLLAAAASGRNILGGAPLETPIHILYVDQEMTQPDLKERIDSLGYDQPDSTLKQHLHYYQLSPWPPLDTAAGGQRLLKEALNVNAQLVVIDTLIRTVEGEENSADTIKNFSRYTAVPLKAAGIALLRIDHAGKDLTRGQRGTSAKRDDVDVVWLLKPASGNLPGKTMLTLKREAARVGWIQEDIHITRNEGPPLAHTIPSFSELTSADFAIVHYLQEQGLWRHNITIRSARAALNRSTLMAKTQRLNNIVKWMKRYGDTPPPPQRQGNAEGNAKRAAEGNAKGNAKRKRGTCRSEAGNTRGTQNKKRNRVRGTKPPIGGAWYPPKIPTKRKACLSHGKITKPPNLQNTTLWVNAPAAPATAKNATSPPNSPVPTKSLAAATQDPTSLPVSTTPHPNSTEPASCPKQSSTPVRHWAPNLSTAGQTVENLAHAVSLHYMHYNFARPHKALGKRTTPAMAAGVAEYPWTTWDIAHLLDD